MTNLDWNVDIIIILVSFSIFHGSYTWQCGFIPRLWVCCDILIYIFFKGSSQNLFTISVFWYRICFCNFLTWYCTCVSWWFVDKGCISRSNPNTTFFWVTVLPFKSSSFLLLVLSICYLLFLHYVAKYLYYNNTIAGILTFSSRF